MAFDKGKIMRWVTIAIIAMFVVEMFIVLTYTNAPAPEQNQTLVAPTPRTPVQFAGTGLAIATVTMLSGKIYAACNANATPEEIEQAIAGIPGLAQATRETGAVYSAQAPNETLSNPEKLSETIAELQKALAGKCTENATILRDGFIALSQGTSCENPFDLNSTEDYAQQTGLQNQEGTACKNLSFAQVSNYLRNNGMPGIPAFTSWQTVENQSIIARINARLIDAQATYLVADELALPQQEEQPQETEAKQTTELNQTTGTDTNNSQTPEANQSLENGQTNQTLS